MKFATYFPASGCVVLYERKGKYLAKPIDRADTTSTKDAWQTARFKWGMKAVLVKKGVLAPGSIPTENTVLTPFDIGTVPKGFHRSIIATAKKHKVDVAVIFKAYVHTEAGEHLFTLCDGWTVQEDEDSFTGKTVPTALTFFKSIVREE